MATADEVRAAAERILECEAEGRHPSVRAGDVYKLARAWLAANPADDGELLTETWVRLALPNTSSYGRRGDYSGPRGQVAWGSSEMPGQFCVWLNGAIYPWKESTRGQFRLLLIALGVPFAPTLPQDSSQ